MVNVLGVFELRLPGDASFVGAWQERFCDKNYRFKISKIFPCD